jgi:hypothetical protein
MNKEILESVIHEMAILSSKRVNPYKNRKCCSLLFILGMKKASDVVKAIRSKGK